MADHSNFLIIGTSAAAIGAVNKLVRLVPDASITMISNERELPYNKCFLADYVAGSKTESHLYTRPREFFAQHGVAVHLGTTVTQLLPTERVVVCADRRRFLYDKLLLTLGSRPIVPSLPGSEGVTGVLPFYNFADAQTVLAGIDDQYLRRAVVIGAGLTGLECADALQLRGVRVSVVDLAPRVLPRLVDSTAAALIEQHMRERGVDWYPRTTVEQVLSCDGQVAGVKLSSGQKLSTDFVLIAVGMRPNSQLARDAGLAMVQSGCVEVDEFLRTSDDATWAAGDVIEVTDQLTGERVPSCMWADAMLQGAISAQNMAGTVRSYPGVTVTSSSEFFGMPFAACGPVRDPGPELCAERRASVGAYELVLRTKTGAVGGFLLIGGTNGRLPQLRRAVMTGQAL